MTRKYVLTVDEFAQAIGVSVTTAYRMLSDGDGPPHRHARKGPRSRILIPVVTFERWLEQNEEPAAPTATGPAEQHGAA